MSNREELAAVLHHRKLPYGGLPGIHTSLDANAAYAAAELVLAAGYRKLRTITTVEELDALPVGTVIKDRDVCQLFRTGWRAMIHEDHGDPWLTDTMEIDLPATVLYEPEQP